MAEMPEFKIQATTIVRAFKPGDVVIIECKDVLSMQSAAHLQAYLKSRAPDITFVILDNGMRVAGREEIVEIHGANDGNG